MAAHSPLRGVREPSCCLLSHTARRRASVPTPARLSPASSERRRGARPLCPLQGLLCARPLLPGNESFKTDLVNTPLSACRGGLLFSTSKYPTYMKIHHCIRNNQPPVTYHISEISIYFTSSYPVSLGFVLISAPHLRQYQPCGLLSKGIKRIAYV